MDKVANCFNRVPAKHCPGAGIGHGAALPCRFGGCVAMALACFACGAWLASAQCSANFAVAQMCGAFGAKARNLVLGIHAHGGGFAFVWRAVGGGVVVGAVDFRHASERYDVACDFLFGNAVKNVRTMLVPRFCGGLICGRGYVGSIEARSVKFGDPFGLRPWFLEPGLPRRRLRWL